MADRPRRNAHHSKPNKNIGLYWARSRRPSHLLTVIGLVVVVLLFVLVFGLSVATSISIWPLGIAEINAGTNSAPPSEIIGFQVVMTLLALLGFGLVLGAVGQSRRWTPFETIRIMFADRPPTSVMLGMFGLFVLAGQASGSAANSVGQMIGHLPQREELGGSGVLDVVAQWTSLVMAGFMEEPVIVGVPVLLFVVVGRGSIGLAIATSMVFRWMVHLYYGPGSVAYLFWALVAVVLYLYGRTLIPLIAAHVWWNVGVGLQMFGFISSLELNMVTIVVGFLAFSFACANLDTVSDWVTRNPWNARLLRPVLNGRGDRAVVGQTRGEERRAKAWRVVRTGFADTLVAVFGAVLGIITSLNELSWLHLFVFVSLFVGSMFALLLAHRSDRPWLSAWVLVLNITYYGAASCTYATRLFDEVPEPEMVKFVLWGYVIGAIVIIFLLSLVKRGMELIPDREVGISSQRSEGD